MDEQFIYDWSRLRTFNRYLEDSVGNIYMNNDYSVTANEFTLTPNAGEIIIPTQLTISLTDLNMTAPKFGGIAGGLTVGFAVYIKRNTTNILELTPSAYPIKTNGDLLDQTFSNNTKNVSFGFGDDILKPNYDFIANNSWVTLNNLSDEYLSITYLSITLNDDLSDLTNMIAIVTGKVFNLKY
jgi:hypothetical protein